jgi:glyoxylase-like metal-dependent hydrolase (beta-lactamase superfamily II)
VPEKLGRGPLAATLEEVADGVWLLRGDVKRAMNIYFLRDGDGVVQFDGGTQPMVSAAREAAQRLGGLKRIVLGHVDSDHRGTAPYLGAPVYCHPGEREAAEAKGPYRDYWDMSRLIRRARLVYPALHRRWDGGPVQIAGLVGEGDEVAGFRVVEFPGHAPGMIGLWRESDRLVLCTDTVYFGDSETFKPYPPDEASVPHPCWNFNTEQARESLRKLAALNPAIIAAGHEEPRRGPGLVPMLERAAEKQF